MKERSRDRRIQPRGKEIERRRQRQWQKKETRNEAILLTNKLQIWRTNDKLIYAHTHTSLLIFGPSSMIWLSLELSARTHCMMFGMAQRASERKKRIRFRRRKWKACRGRSSATVRQAKSLCFALSSFYQCNAARRICSDGLPLPALHTASS